MLKSVLFRKALIICVIILLLCNIILLAAYSAFGKRTYVDLELDSLTSVMTAAQHFYNLSDSIFVDPAYFSQALALLSSTNDVSVYYYDSTTHLIYTNIQQYSYECMDKVTAELLTGKQVRLRKLNLSHNINAICVGTPLYNHNNEIVGGVTFVREVQHIDKAFEKLNSVLWIMTALILPLMLILAYISIKRMSKPFADMTETAIQLANGNYKVRANENLSGEIGIFARAMNQMSDALAQTIYQLDSEKRQLGYILSSFSEGVAALDNLGNLTHYNPALMKMFGTVDVKQPIDLVPDKSIWEAFHAVLDSKEPRSLHYELNGDKTLWISIVPVMTDDGNCTGVVGLFKDISEMEKLERMRRDYVANISHELRTPLTAVRGLLEPMADGMVKDEAMKKRYYDIMLHEIERLSRLITDMLQLSRLQAGTEYMELRPFNISELIADVAQSYQQQLIKRKQKLDVELCDSCDVISDSDRIEQVLVILLDNAMRYAGENGRIRITTTQDTSDVYVSVWDSGCGISPEDIEHVFERFYKADKSRKEGGTGLGLSIAKQVIDKLGEHIEVDSKLGEWTCFRFSVKKYVSNAIQLGPVNDRTIIYSEEPQLEPANTDDEISIDAPFEVIEGDETKPKREKKRLPGFKEH